MLWSDVWEKFDYRVVVQSVDFLFYYALGIHLGLCGRGEDCFCFGTVEEEECCGEAGKVCCLGHAFALCLSCCSLGILFPLCCQDSPSVAKRFVSILLRRLRRVYFCSRGGRGMLRCSRKGVSSCSNFCFCHRSCCQYILFP